MRTASSVVLAFVWLALAASPAHAQVPGDVLTLDRAVELALASNRTLQMAGLEQAKAGDDVAALRTRRLPSFDLKAFEGGFLAPLQFTFAQGVFGTFPATGPIPLTDLTVDSPRQLSTAILFTAVQPLTQLRKISRGESLLKLNGDLAGEKLRGLRHQVIGDVRRTYYGLQQTYAGLAALQVGLTQLVELERVVSHYVGTQVALPADLLVVRTEHARAERDVLVLRNLQATLAERINMLMGRDLATPVAVAPLPAPGLDVPSLDAAVASAKASRPALREAEITVRRAAADLDLHALDRMPDVSLGLGVLRLVNVEVLPRNVAAAAVFLSWQPFDWGRRGHEADARNRTLEQARLGLAEAQAGVELDVRSKGRAVAEAHAALGVAQRGTEAAAERLRVATDRYQAEASLFKDVLEAQTEMARATQLYQQALGAFWTARADLEQAVGDQP